MLRRTIEYEDFEGKKRKEDFYFHLQKSELVTWLSADGDYTMDKVLERLVKSQNKKEVMEIFEDLLHRSYGVKSLDGRTFIKTEEEWQKFRFSPAYDVIFMELVGSGEKAAQFVNAVIPKDLAEEIAKIVKENPDAISDEMKDYLTEDMIKAFPGNKLMEG